MKAIIAVNNRNYIGKENKLPWNCKEDLLHFKKLTKDKILLCGYNTYKTLPNVVKQRTTVLLDERNNLLSFENHEDIWCIGGKKTYEKYCHLFSEIHISRIDDNVIGDTEFPELKNINKDCQTFIYNFQID